MEKRHITDIQDICFTLDRCQTEAKELRKQLADYSGDNDMTDVRDYVEKLEAKIVKLNAYCKEKLARDRAEYAADQKEWKKIDWGDDYD
uniref:ING domain-containing protein n=1 Tax=Panagrellus redivivus TaxID=6233 RepID=A0A7E4ZZT6_PANRE